MRTLESGPQQEKLPPLTKKELARIIWKSFEFSQGFPIQQMRLLHKVRTYYDEAPDLDYPEFARELQMRMNTGTAVPSTEDPAFEHMDVKLASAHHTLAIKNMHSEVSISQTASAYDDIMEALDILSSKAPSEVSNEVIVSAFWRSDKEYLIDRHGRPNRDEEKAGSNTLADPYFSFSVQYLLRENSSGVAVFDRILEELRMIPLSSLSDEAKSDVQDVVNAYNQTHPDTPIEIPALGE